MQRLGRSSIVVLRRSEGALSKVKAKPAKVKGDWARKRERAELDLANIKEVVEAMEKFKASENFAMEKAQAVAGFRKSEEFFVLYRDFGQESYEGFNRESKNARQPF